jgi:hypothetical protein
MSACGRSFETPRKSAAPQDDGFVFCRSDFAIAIRFPNTRKML